MNRIILIIMKIMLPVLCSAILISCTSTEKVQTPDSYANTTDVNSQTSDSSTSDTNQNTSGGIQSLFVAHEDARDRIGSGSAFVENFTSTELKQYDCDFYYDRENDNVKMFISWQGALYCLEFNTADRARIRSAVSFYLDDFAAHSLSKKNSTSYKIYGEVPVVVRWGLLSIMMTDYASPSMQLGYKFKKDSPYFTFNFWPTENKAYKEGNSKIEKMPKFTLYMTKSQSKTVADMLDEARITKVRNNGVGSAEKKTQADSY